MDGRNYIMEERNAVGTVNIPKEITARDIETIIVNGFEGGIGYWAGLKKDELWDDKPSGVPSSMWATKLILEDKEVILYDRENPEEWAALTLEKLINGIQLNYNRRNWDCDIENGDATTYDCIIQYALFGDIVYG
jgi:hypothetical protein